MRFCIAIWTAMLLLVTPVFGEGSEGESCKHDDKHSGEHKCKHKRKKIHFDYGWYISMSDEQLGEEPHDSDGFIRKISSEYWTGISFEKKWEEYNLSLYYDFSQEKVSDGFIIATVNAELPRSYLSIEVGKTQLHFGGFRDHTSPYLSYHSPFSTYAAMGRIYAPLEGFGELSLMVTNDVLHDEEEHGAGETRRWHVKRQTIAPLFQYSGEFGMVSPMLQFAFYDFGSPWYRSWAATASLKVNVDKMAMSIDGTWDKRQHPTKDGEFTNYVNMVADLSHRHGMVKMTLEASHFMTIEDPEANKVEGNRMPIEKGKKPEDYDKMKDEDKAKNPYTIAETYNKGSWMKYGDNMTAVAARLDIHCIEGKFVPYVKWAMKHHKIDDQKFKDHVVEKDDKKHIDEQMSHTITVGIEGRI